MNLNTKISTGFSWDVTKGSAVGIELEFENSKKSIFTKRLRDWSLIADPSLRNGGVEFVSKILPKTQVNAALTRADKVIKEYNLSAHVRCGLHVHVNVTDITFGQLWAMSMLYAFAEPNIFKKFAADRVDNHFCVPNYANQILLDGS